MSEVFKILYRGDRYSMYRILHPTVPYRRERITEVGLRDGVPLYFIDNSNVWANVDKMKDLKMCNADVFEAIETDFPRRKSDEKD